MNIRAYSRTQSSRRRRLVLSRAWLVAFGLYFISHQVVERSGCCKFVRESEFVNCRAKCELPFKLSIATSQPID